MVVPIARRLMLHESPNQLEHCSRSSRARQPMHNVTRGIAAQDDPPQTPPPEAAHLQPLLLGGGHELPLQLAGVALHQALHLLAQRRAGRVRRSPGVPWALRTLHKATSGSGRDVCPKEPMNANEARGNPCCPSIRKSSLIRFRIAHMPQNCRQIHGQIALSCHVVFSF